MLLTQCLDNNCTVIFQRLLVRQMIFLILSFLICNVLLCVLLGRRKVINQTSFVDMSVVEILTTISSTSIPLLESRITTLTPTSKTLSETEESDDSSAPTQPPSMFSTSMAPPRPTPAGQEEELITTVAPIIKEEHDDTDLNVEDFVSENVTSAEFVPQRGDTFTVPQDTSESTESVSKPTEEPDDLSVIEINTIQPDVPIPDTSVITEPMFAVGKSEETVLDSRITSAMTSNLTDTPTETIELTSKEVFSSSESTPSTTWPHSTTPFPDFNPDYVIDDIETLYGVEAEPPPQPSQQDPSSSPSEVPYMTTETTFMRNTQPGSEVEITTTGPLDTTSTATKTTPQMQHVETPAVAYKEETTSAAATASAVLIDSETSAEDVTLSTSVHVFDESTTQLPDHSASDTLTVDDTEIDTEFFTSSPMDSDASDRTTSPGPVVGDEQSTQVTSVMQMQNASGKTYTLNL